ncbi:MAG TPA: ATP-binding protein [Acidimicrobiales bacterium]|nr:ATP-binding protein [Acidimicrobiales bacterium]
MPLEINLSLCLPRDELSVPVVRHICRFSMSEVGVDPSCVDAILLALTEACTNVLDHATVDDDYEVTLTVDDARCIIRVKDGGIGFEHVGDDGTIDLTAESGRGIGMMRALVDRVDFETKAEDGTIVHLEKALEFDDTHPVRTRLVNDRS